MKVKNLIKILKDFDPNMDIQFMMDTYRSEMHPGSFSGVEIVQDVLEGESSVELTVPVLNLIIKE